MPEHDDIHHPDDVYYFIEDIEDAPESPIFWTRWRIIYAIITLIVLLSFLAYVFQGVLQWATGTLPPTPPPPGLAA